MNFFDATIQQENGAVALLSPLFPSPVPLKGSESGGKITLGIRPEDIRLSSEPRPNTVEGKIARKSITIGRQYLIAVNAGGVTFKAKAPSATGQSLSGPIWVELPLERITLFKEDGSRADLMPVGVATSATPGSVP
jgi:ABC-type sugar transport system ATPase subunit